MADKKKPNRLLGMINKSWSQESGEKLGKIVEESKKQRDYAKESPEARGDRERKQHQKYLAKERAKRTQGDAFDEAAWEEVYKRTHEY